MIDVPENIKEIIDAAIRENLSPFMERLSQAESQQMKEKEQEKNNIVDDGCSEAVKQYVKDFKNNPFEGKSLNETQKHRFHTTPESLSKL